MLNAGASDTHGSQENVKIAQDPESTPAIEPPKPARSEGTSVAKSAGHSSAFKTPISAVRSGDRWGSLTVADILGLSPGIRGPSLLLSPLCSRAAPVSPGLTRACWLKAVAECTRFADALQGHHSMHVSFRPVL